MICAAPTVESRVISVVRDFYERHFGETPTAISFRDNLDVDLGFDSLSRLEVIAEVETEFDIDFPAIVLEEVSTIGSLVRYVKQFFPRRRGR